MTATRKITVLDQQVDGQHLKLLILTIDGQAIGSCQIVSWNEDEPSILGVLIDPQHRGNGHASALIQTVIEMAKADRKTSLSLTVEKQNIAAISLYRRLGFATDLEDPIQFWMSIPL